MPPPQPIAIPVTRRFLCALALLPVVPASAVLGVYTIDAAFPAALGGKFDWLQCFQLLFSILWVAGMILVWRRAIVWSLGRTWLTAITALIPFVQVVWARPLWTAPGCRMGIDEMLMTGQHQATVGFWVWIAVWVWWGFERRAAMNVGPSMLGGGQRALVSRLVASLATLPFVFAVFLIASGFLEDFTSLSSESGLVAATWIAALIVVLVWVQIWRGIVHWDARTRGRTVASAILLLGVPLALLSILHDGVSAVWDVMIWCLPIIGWGAWMAYTGFVWSPWIPRDPAETGPSCLQCGYSLRGLRATRCPECGDEPTLDALWSGTTGV